MWDKVLLARELLDPEWDECYVKDSLPDTYPDAPPNLKSWPRQLWKNWANEQH